MRAPPSLSTRQIMIRPNRTTPSQLLLELARDPTISIRDLEDILEILAQRKNPFALWVYIEVGKLLEAAKKRGPAKGPNSVPPIDGPTIETKDYFDWPSTDAPAGTYGFSGKHWHYKEGLLSYVGYRVGRNGVDKQVRQSILDCVFHNELPQVDSEEYMRQWDAPKSAARLQKMAESLAAFTRNAKRKDFFDYRDAIADWESDLSYLWRKYYRDHFGFAWPVLQDKD